MTTCPADLVERLVRHAAESFSVSAELVTSKSRRRPVVRARNCVAYVLAERGYSTPAIAAALNFSSHSSVVYAMESVEWKPDEDVDATIDALRAVG